MAATWRNTVQWNETLRDLSLHILDLVENSIRAGADSVEVTLQAEHENDTLRVCIEDNGPGFPAAAELAWDPFFTTKGKKTGLGLSLFRAAAEQAGGRLQLGASRLGGAMVSASMGLSHVDRPPIGDLAASIAMLAVAESDLKLRLTLIGRETCSMAPEEIARLIGRRGSTADLSMVGRLVDAIRQNLARAGL